MTKDLFTVILLHYNQPRYVLSAIDSVLKQNYNNIEIILADDASTDIDLDMIKDYINVNKKDNISNIEYCINEINQGTVKTINRAVKAAKGKYILFFAADDALYDENVVANFEKSFRKAEDNVYMISSQCHMMDEQMKNELSVFVRPTQAASFNKMTAFEQFRVFSSTCFLAIGATAMRNDMFEKFGYFNETYKFIEDWAYFLHLTRSGGLIRYVDFNGLLHRDGGISHYETTGVLPKHVLQYKLDMIHIFENEIMPYFKHFESKERTLIFQRYHYEKHAYYNGGGTEKVLSKLKLFKMFPSHFIRCMLLPFLDSWSPLLKVTKFTAYLSAIYIGYSIASLEVFNRQLFLLYILEYSLIISTAVVLIVLFMSFGLKFFKALKHFIKRR
ncbi:MAG: glycosyltransferase [Clostridiales bacterium]|nr:glycosyltransferase [Clostridiales bacterium]